MSFTITCDKCGNKRIFTSESERYTGEDVSIGVFGSYHGRIVETIDIDCDNPKCNNGIEINC